MALFHHPLFPLVLYYGTLFPSVFYYFQLCDSHFPSAQLEGILGGQKERWILMDDVCLLLTCA